MMGQTAVDVSSDTDPRDPELSAWLATLPPLRAAGRDIMLIVAEEPLCGLLLELAHASGFDAFACETPLDVVGTLVDAGDRIACAVVSTGTAWGEGLAELLADEYPAIQRVQIAA